MNKSDDESEEEESISNNYFECFKYICVVKINLWN